MEVDLKLKVDSNLFHHYIIAVAVYPADVREKAGELYLKYRPIHFTNNDIEKVQNAAMLVNDKLFKTSNSEAVKITSCEEIVREISGLKLAAAVNQCTIHHFSSSFEIEEENFVTIIKSANKDDYFRNLLKQSLIR
jgi:hypothetical protein